MLLATFELIVARALRVMSLYGSNVKDIKKSVVKTLLNIFLTVKTE